ncbi:adhesion G-protein coupled receptor G2 [Anoplopoma fimbria]|uniref:adhesion G-protein coupled receptor G2 n=1 Tax=Anoplopoma fimbria TaxID=229290 RepID=UPI0023EE1243|nr:adhesion G-protein coupled receptor G2 [Anoplopoma fimbria]
MERVHRLSLWGKVADFTFTGCSQWRLKPQVFIPALQELTVCFNLKFKSIEDSTPWTAFTYTHPKLQCTELGLGGQRDRLVVWLFGTEWTTPKINLRLSHWYSLCLTWSHAKERPALYVDGNLVDVMADTTPSIPNSSCKLAPNGRLTLGASHRLVNGTIIPHPAPVGLLSLFRFWGRERSKKEVTSLNCTEGDLVKWERDHWDTHNCFPLPDPRLQCEWSVYEVRLMFAIIRSDGNDTELYTARDIAHKWLRKILPASIYLNRVSVFEVTRFDCLVHINVIPSVDVADVQNEMCTSLSKLYHDPSCQLQLLADTGSIHTTPVESFSAVTMTPPIVGEVTTTTFKTSTSISIASTITSASTSAATSTTFTTNPANISELFFEVKVNVSITGDCDPGQIISTWLNSSLPDDMMLVLDLQLLPKARSKLCLRTHWMAPDLEDCQLVVETIPDLDHVEVTADNALDVVVMIKGLLRDHSTLNYQELVTVLNKLEDVVSLSRVTPILGQALINTISDILESDSNLLPFTNTILNLTEAVGDMMVGYEGSSTLVAPAIAISVVDVVPGQFSSLTFGVSSDRAGTKPEIFINKYPFNGTVAFISLPSALQQSFPQNSSNQSQPRVKFQFFGIPMLFKSSQKGQYLNTFVVSASVTNASSPIKDLDEDVKVTLHHLIPNIIHKDVQCVYWNFNKNNGQGGWDDYGCRKYNGSSDYTTCLCDHLTHFGVLLDVSRTQVDPANEQILTIITYAGCGVSSVFLGITVLTYTAFEKLRRDYPSQILINLSLALLGLNLVFLVNSTLSSLGVYGLCVAVASTLHYFLLASFTWMGLEAVNMYFALVKVFNVYVPSYILKFCALGWGIPLVICTLVLIVNREAYGSHLYTDVQNSLKPLDNSDNFCWLQDDVTFYVSVVAYAVLVFLFNIAVFVVVLIQIRHMRANSPAGTRSGLMHDLKGVASLTLLLGLTWTVGFFTWGPARVVLLYLFSALNTLQGLLIFLFHCLMKENVRKQWRIHLCFGRFRLDEYSEWSNSASVGVPAKPKSNPPRALVPSVCSVKSSSTESTSASSDSSQRDSSCKRPNLGLFVNSLALPRAQRSTPGPEALPSQRGMDLTPGWNNHLLG